MNIATALNTYTNYPIPASTIERILVDRGLDTLEEYSPAIAVGTKYLLAKADVFMFLFSAPDLEEERITITLSEREYFFSYAQNIYGKLEPTNVSGTTVAGFIGEEFNT